MIDVYGVKSVLFVRYYDFNKNENHFYAEASEVQVNTSLIWIKDGC